MRFLTLSTTGIFDAIRPSLFPPIEGKETTTFLLALDYYILDGSFSSGEEEDVETARKYYDLERKRIRAFIKALCNDCGKPIEELRTEVINCLPEFIRDGTYNGEPLLSERREGYYTVYPMYKSYRGRELLFPTHGTPKEEAQYIFDHMLRYFLKAYFSPDAFFGYYDGALHLDTPVSVTTVQQTLEELEREAVPSPLSVSSIPNTYIMDEHGEINSEFLLIADAFGAYMVQVMEGDTESEQLAALSEDAFVCEMCCSLHKCFMINNRCFSISIYDECNIWIDKLLDAYAVHDYSQILNIYNDEFPSYDDGVIGYEKQYLLEPLLDNLVKDLTREKLLVQLSPKDEHRKDYLNFILTHDEAVQSIFEEIYENRLDGRDIYKQQDLANVLTLDVRLCCTFYCMIDACRHAFNRRMYASILPIVDKLDAQLSKVQISATDTWQVEYLVKLSRISQWYRSLAYACLEDERVEPILQDLMVMQQQDPVLYKEQMDSIFENLDDPEHAFNIEDLRYALLHYYIETNNQPSYERYIKELYPPILGIDSDYKVQKNILLYGEDGKYCENYSNRDFYLWLKALWTFYLDDIDKAFWNEMAEQWEQQDYIPIFYGINDYELCANYMIKLAVHFGDIQRAEKYKKEFDMAIPNKKKPMEDAPSGYRWPFFDCYLIAQVNETLGNIEIAKEYYHKALSLATFGEARWEQYEEQHGGIWKTYKDFGYSGPDLKFEDWIKDSIVTYKTIEEYKTALDKYVFYMYK